VLGGHAAVDGRLCFGNRLRQIRKQARRHLRRLKRVFRRRGDARDRNRRRLVGIQHVVELPIAQSDEHRLVLLLHQLAYDFGELFVAEVLHVRRLDGLEDPPTIHEQMGDDVRMTNARVFRLDVEELSAVPDVVIEA
jgi:hypothetical protein